jgi:hypothetical protein
LPESIKTVWPTEEVDNNSQLIVILYSTSSGSHAEDGDHRHEVVLQLGGWLGSHHKKVISKKVKLSL